METAMDITNEQIASLVALADEIELIIVEDDVELLAHFRKLFGRFFETVYSAGNIDAALEVYTRRLEADIPILLVTDIDLGEESGIDLITRVKKLNPHQKTIAMSDVANDQVFIDAIRCGVDRFVLKPVQIGELADALSAVLKSIYDALELQRSQQMLESSRQYAIRLLEEQDEFLKNAIHEMHTPLSVIITNIDLMRLDGIESESLDSIEAASRIIQNSYSDMTYLMKRDDIRESSEVIDLVSFTKERMAYFSCIAKVNDLDMTLQVTQPDIPALHFPLLKLTRIIDNTISNAIKYAHHPSLIEVMVGLKNGKTFFGVKNRGPVIKDKDKIFDRFYREERTKGGYGLGLNIVGRICREEHVGIEISSSQEKGTLFRYTFNMVEL